jgi:predicted O-methyltransferase YrrM
LLRHLVKQALGAGGRTRVGKNLVNAAVQADPGLRRYANVDRWPPTIEGFEDLAFLFASNQLNHGIVSLQLDEAALLFRLARRAPEGATLVEIGRFKGGSTLLLASALPPAAQLWSYDLHVAIRADMSGSQLDAELRTALERYGLAERVHLVVGDSRTASPPPLAAYLVFVDGDHRYEGARADYERWSELVAPGGHLLFHDAVDSGGYGNVYPGISRLVEEIERNDRRFERQLDAGSIAHFHRPS